MINTSRLRKLFFPAAVFLSGAMLFISFIPVLYLTRNEPFLYLAGKFIAGRLCHTDPDKIPFLFGHHLLLCSRCTGIYSGAFLAGIILRAAANITKFRLKDPLKLPLIMLIPMAADVVLYNTGVYSYNFIIAWFTGFLSGSGVILYIWNDFFRN